MSKEHCDYLKPKGSPGPTKIVMEYIVHVNPHLTVKELVETLMKIQRRDVVYSLKKFFCGNVYLNY